MKLYFLYLNKYLSLLSWQASMALHFAFAGTPIVVKWCFPGACRSLSSHP